MNTIFIANSKNICEIIAYIFDADIEYIDRLFEKKKFILPKVDIFNLTLRFGTVTFAKIFTPDVIASFANTILFLDEDEEDVGILTLKSAFINNILSKYNKIVNYGEEIIQRCDIKGIDNKNIDNKNINLLNVVLNDLQEEIDSFGI